MLGAALSLVISLPLSAFSLRKQVVSRLALAMPMAAEKIHSLAVDWRLAYTFAFKITA